MYKAFIESINTWNTTRNERQKLQAAYLVLGALIVLVSGLLALLNPSMAHTLVTFGFGMLAVFVINGAVWHLLSSIVLSQLKTKPKRK